jgi:hypothetical protein
MGFRRIGVGGGEEWGCGAWSLGVFCKGGWRPVPGSLNWAEVLKQRKELTKGFAVDWEGSWEPWVMP